MRIKLLTFFFKYTRSNLFITISTKDLQASYKVITVKSMGTLGFEGRRNKLSDIARVFLIRQLKKLFNLVNKKILKRGSVRSNVIVSGFNRTQNNILRKIFKLIFLRKKYTVMNSIKTNVNPPFNGCRLRKRRRKKLPGHYRALGRIFKVLKN